MPKIVNSIHLVLNLDIGGLEKMVINLLKGIDRESFNPSIVCLLKEGNLIQEVRKMNINIDVLHKPDKLHFSSVLKLAKILKKRKISLIHTHNTGAYLYGAIAAKLAKVPIIIHTEHGRVFPDKKRLMAAERLLSMFTYKIIAVSEDLRKSLIKHEHINSSKITVIPNGIDLSLFKPLQKELVLNKRYELGLNKDDVVVGTVGRLAAVKNHKMLIKAFKIFAEKNSDAKLVITGDGPLREELIGFSEKLDLQDRILFLGERSDIPELLNVFDVFVLSSKNEGTSLTLLEAMASKKVVIATDVGGNKEIIENRKNGYLVSPDSPQEIAKILLEIIDDSREAVRLSNNAYETVKSKYSLEKMVDDYQEIYESALLRR